MNQEEQVRAQYDAMSENERRSLFRGLMEQNPPTDSELGEAFIEYVSTVSPDFMAMGFASAHFLSELCKNRKPNVAADFGSGFSSYVLRRYAATSGAQVISVDDSPEWLDKTRAFVQSQGLSADGMVTWDEWLVSEYPAMDVAFHDLASGDLRESSMQIIADRMARGGALLFDDAQHDGHRRAMMRVGRLRGWRFNVLPETLDGNGRYEAMAVAP